jgi:putative polyketide hydroxylase
MSDAGSDRAQVLVVGAGPAGLVAGITLADHGVSVLVVEKRSEISTLSRALVISTRSMEILRSWGLEGEVRAGAADVEPCGWVTRTLASGEGVQIPLGYPTAAEATKVSPSRPAWAPQDHLEPALLSRLRSLPGAEIRFGSELVTVEQREGGVCAHLHERASGRIHDVDAQFVIGADGAHSTVRTQLGIRMEGPDALAEFHSVQFSARLARLVGDRRYGLNVITHPDAAGVLAPRGPNDRWSYAREWRPGQPRLVDCPTEQLAALIATAVGTPDLQLRIERVSAFSFAAQIADRYRDQRIFVVGDAAHRMTPRGGTGMNTAIHDAYDLGWKLAWVLRGWAKPGLLASYEAERRPVGLHNVLRSGDPDGARRQADDALPWDLNGRLPHHWVPRGSETISTLDLLGNGLTLLVGPAEPRWPEAGASLNTRAPLSTHAVDERTAHSVGIQPGGAVLLRPDGQALVHWPALTTPLHRGSLPGDLCKRAVT